MESKRQRQVAEVVKRNFSMVLQQEGTYIYDNALVTVTKVKMSPDLGIAKIYCSVYNTGDKNRVINLLEGAHHRLRQHFAQRVRKHLRRIPELRYYLDETLDEMYKLNALFDRLHEEDQMGEEE